MKKLPFLTASLTPSGVRRQMGEALWGSIRALDAYGSTDTVDQMACMQDVTYGGYKRRFHPVYLALKDVAYSKQTIGIDLISYR